MHTPTHLVGETSDHVVQPHQVNEAALRAAATPSVATLLQPRSPTAFTGTIVAALACRTAGHPVVPHPLHEHRGSTACNDCVVDVTIHWTQSISLRIREYVVVLQTAKHGVHERISGQWWRG